MYGVCPLSAHRQNKQLEEKLGEARTLINQLQRGISDNQFNLRFSENVQGNIDANLYALVRIPFDSIQDELVTRGLLSLEDAMRLKQCWQDPQQLMREYLIRSHYYHGIDRWRIFETIVREKYPHLFDEDL